MARTGVWDASHRTAGTLDAVARRPHPYAGRMSQYDKDFATRFSAHRAEAEAVLRRRMEARGLYERDGWRIAETTRDARQGTELVIRPIHLRHPSPDGLECVVWVRGEDGSVDVHCFPDEA